MISAINMLSLITKKFKGSRLNTACRLFKMTGWVSDLHAFR